MAKRLLHNPNDSDVVIAKDLKMRIQSCNRAAAFCHLPGTHLRDDCDLTLSKPLLSEGTFRGDNPGH